jgi:hypothetical protein
VIDIYVDDVKCESINTIKEGYVIHLKKGKFEELTVMLSEENFVDLYHRMKRRCETQNLIPIYNER